MPNQIIYTDKSIADQIKKLRLKHNLSQARFGKKLGVSGKAISAYENSRCLPSVEILNALTTIFEDDFISNSLSLKDDVISKISYLKKQLFELEELISNSKEQNISIGS